MQQPDTAAGGGLPHIKHHQFSASGLAGVLVYRVDQGPMVRMSFSNKVQLTIWVYPGQENTELSESENGSVSDSNHVNAENLSASACATVKSVVGSKRVSAHEVLPSLLLENQHTKQRRKSSCIQRTKSFHLKSNGLKMQEIQETGAESDSTDCKMKSILANKYRQAELSLTEAGSQDMCEADSVESVCQDAAGQANDREEAMTKCQYCQKEFSTLRDFYDHRRSEGSAHDCSICGKVEMFKAHLIVHMQRHEKVQLENSTDESCLRSEIEKGSKTKKTKKVKMKCDICGLIVSSIDSLKIHTMLHTGESPYCCCVCGDKFSSLSSRQHHMDTHITVDRFRCVQCNLRFSSRAELAKHQLNHQFRCNLCGEVFPNKTSRTCHYRVAHPQDILRCNECPALFSCQESLQRHKQYHARGQKQQCPTCGLVVSRLKEHMLLHSSTPPSRMFVCDQCPMSYLRKANLERHMRTHTGEKPYACCHCSKRFCSNGMLRKHLLTHTQERPFQCEVCGKRCALRSNLIVHMRVHSSDRRFSCSICGQSFNHKNSLQGHMRSKHSNSKPFPPVSLVGAFGIHADSLTACSSQASCGLSTASHQSKLIPAGTMSSAVGASSKPDYSQLLQLSYSPGGSNYLLDTPNIVASQPAHSVSLNYTNSGS